METLWLPVVSIEPDGEEECVCIAVSHPSRLYVTEGGVITHNTTVDGAGGGVLYAPDGSVRQRITDGLAPGEAGVIDRQEADSAARSLLGSFAQRAEELSAEHDGAVWGAAPGGSAAVQPRVSVAYSSDSSLRVSGLSGNVWQNLIVENNGNLKAALEQLDAMLEEEAWHLAQLAAMRQDWLALPAATRGSFVSHVEQASAALLADIRSQVRGMSEADARAVKQAMVDAWSLYFQGGRQVAASEVAGLFDSLTAPDSGLVASPAMVAEFLRQLQQAQRTGQTTETAGLIARLVEWVKAALANLRRVAGMAQRGELGAATQRLMERMAAIVDGRESVPPFRPRPSRFSGESAAFHSALGTTYRTLPDAVQELQDGMEWARSTREQRTVDGVEVPATAYDVRTDAAMLDASMAVWDSVGAEGLRGAELLTALQRRNLGGARLDLDERQILLRHLLQTGRFHEFGLSRREIMSLMQEGAGKGAMAMREMREVLDPIERLRQESEEKADAELQRVTGKDGDTLHGEMQTAVDAAQEQAMAAELARLRDEASELRKTLERHKADLEEARQNAAKDRLQREAEVQRLQNLLKLAEARVAELEAKPADSTEADARLAEELLKARERAAELRRELKDAQERIAEEQARADQEREVGVAIGREEGKADAEAEYQEKLREANRLDTFENWLMGERVEGLPSVETFARRFLQASRFDAEGFSRGVMALFPGIDPHIVEDAMDRVNESLVNAAAAARRREIQNFMDRLAGRVKPKDQAKLGRFLGSLQRASDFGILDRDTFSAAFAHAFELNGMTPAVAQSLLGMWQELNRLDENGKRAHYGMVRETLEREFLEAVNAVAPGARWDNFIFNQFQAGVLASIGSALNEFSGFFRTLSGMDAVARLAKRGDYNPAAWAGEWWRNVSELFGNLPLVLTGIRGESLGHMGPEVRGNFTPREQSLQHAANGQPMRLRLPGGRTITLPRGWTRLLRLKELYTWRLIRGAEGLSGVTDARARFRDVLAEHYQRQGMSAAAARQQALTDIEASPADRQTARRQAEAEQAAGRIGKGETVLNERVEEIIQRMIEERHGEELTAEAEHLTAAAQFKTMPSGPIGFAIANTFKALTHAEGAGRVVRFFALFGRFLGHTVDTTLGYTPGLHLATLGRSAGKSARHKVITEVWGSVENYNAAQHGKAVAGGAMLLLAGALAALAKATSPDDDEPWFNITGFAPGADRASKDRLKATGQWDEGQIRMFGRPVFNYSQMPELAPLLTIVGNVSDWLRFDKSIAARAPEDGEQGKQSVSLLDAGGATIVDVLSAPLKRSTYKQWVTAAGQMLDGKGGDALANVVTSPIGGALRIPLLVDADKWARKEAGAADAKGWVENTLRRIPFVVVGEKMFNPYGEQLPGFDVLGIVPGDAEVSPEVQRAAKLNVETATSRNVPALNLKYEDGSVREVKPEEREAYIRRSGALFVESLLRNEADIRRAFAQGGQAAAQKIVSNISLKANKQAKEELFK